MCRLRMSAEPYLAWRTPIFSMIQQRIDRTFRHSRDRLARGWKSNARGSVASIYGHVPIDALMNWTDPLMALSGTAKMVVGQFTCTANATANLSDQVGAFESAPQTSFSPHVRVK